ncbi:MAG: hypothetical protein WDO69_25145 [Pseudomonadota bacterium]
MVKDNKARDGHDDKKQSDPPSGVHRKAAYTLEEIASAFGHDAGTTPSTFAAYAMLSASEELHNFADMLHEGDTVCREDWWHALLTISSRLRVASTIVLRETEGAA